MTERRPPCSHEQASLWSLLLSNYVPYWTIDKATALP